MSDPAPTILTDIAVALTGGDRASIEKAMAAGVSGKGHKKATEAAAFLQRLLRQAPLNHDDRTALLAEAELRLPDLINHQPGRLIQAETLLRGATLHIPVVPGPAVLLPPMTAELADIYAALIDLDAHVSEPWTLIGGLMVLTHCAEHGAPFTRVTGDADVAVSVFTHRSALHSLTARLRQTGFRDVTPDPLSGGPHLSYRWSRSAAKIDVAVPSKANEQKDAATAVTGNPSVELPATQQALSRTQRLAITLADGTQGHVLRPDLLGSVVIKAAAAVADRRNPARHREDLVALADLLAISGQHVEYARQVRNKDAKRIRSALALITAREWRGAADPDAARAALEFIVAQVDT